MNFYHLVGKLLELYTKHKTSIFKDSFSLFFFLLNHMVMELAKYYDNSTFLYLFIFKKKTISLLGHIPLKSKIIVQRLLSKMSLKRFHISKTKITKFPPVFLSRFLLKKLNQYNYFFTETGL